MRTMVGAGRVGIVAASAWSGALALAGVRALMLSCAPPVPAVPAWAWTAGGVSFLAMAHLVFCALVADRVFPHANPWLSTAAHVVAGLVLLGGAGCLVGGFLL